MEKKVLYCLVVDDEPLAQQVLENYIRRVAKLQLLAKCESVEDACGILATGNVDVIFLDLDLNAVSGMTVIDKMKGTRQVPYYIVITSAALPQELGEGKIVKNNNAVLVDHLKKPFSFERFLEAIDKLEVI